MIRTRALVAALAVLVAGACSDSTGSQTSKLTLKLTDAPGDFKKAVVTISQIYLQSGDTTSGKLVLRDQPVTVDLLTLANATSDLVSDAVIPSGTYSQLRFIVTGAYVEVENADGTTSIYASSPTYSGLPAGAQVAGSLQMPSFAQTGIKVNLPGGSVQVTGDQKIMLVDFDVSRSFGQQAGSKWVMSPVLNATEFALTGGVLATLTKDASVTMPSGVTLGSFSAVLTNAAGTEKTVTFTDANGDGTFEAKFLYLIPDTYTVDITPPTTGVSTFTTNPTHPQNVTVASGQTPTKAFVLTAVSP